jgi:undecaprenol kinase
MRVELAVAVIVVFAGILFRITSVEWALTFVCIGLILSAELVNTAIELAVDLRTQRFHPMAKLSKDAGAGAVLIAALTSVAVGIAIFGPRLWRLLSGGGG